MVRTDRVVWMPGVIGVGVRKTGIDLALLLAWRRLLTSGQFLQCDWGIYLQYFQAK